MHSSVALCAHEASALDPAGPVSVTVDLGGQRKVSAVDIHWEFPAGSGRPEIFADGAWSPVCSSGASSGAAGVLCKSMGFSGATGSSKCSGLACGGVAPGLGALACSGSESGPLACPHEAGDDVFCAPSESLVVTCAGEGETQGRPAKETAPQPTM